MICTMVSFFCFWSNQGFKLTLQTFALLFSALNRERSRAIKWFYFKSATASEIMLPKYHFIVDKTEFLEKYHEKLAFKQSSNSYKIYWINNSIIHSLEIYIQQKIHLTAGNLKMQQEMFNSETMGKIHCLIFPTLPPTSLPPPVAFLQRRFLIRICYITQGNILDDGKL